MYILVNIDFFKHILKEWISQEDCGSKLLPKVELECETLGNGDLKIKVIGKDNQPKVYLGMHNMMEDAEKVSLM